MSRRVIVPLTSGPASAARAAHCIARELIPVCVYCPKFFSKNHSEEQRCVEKLVARLTDVWSNSLPPLQIIGPLATGDFDALFAACEKLAVENKIDRLVWHEERKSNTVEVVVMNMTTPMVALENYTGKSETDAGIPDLFQTIYPCDSKSEHTFRRRNGVLAPPLKSVCGFCSPCREWLATCSEWYPIDGPIPITEAERALEGEDGVGESKWISVVSTRSKRRRVDRVSKTK